MSAGAKLRVGVGNVVAGGSVIAYVVRVDSDGDWLGFETQIDRRPLADRDALVEHARRCADVLGAEFHDEQS